MNDPDTELNDREKKMVTVLRQLEEADAEALLRVAERMLPPTTVHRPPGDPGNEN